MRTHKTKLQKRAEKIRMRAAERHDVRERLLCYMEYHPRREQLPITTKHRVSRTQHEMSSIAWKAMYTRFFNTRVKAVGGVFMFLLIVSVPFAAERALPGDVLYLIKVGFNEEVRSQLSLTPYQKVAWETEMVERRIAEARLLASEGKLTDEVRAAIEEEVREHTQAAQEELTVLHEQNADEAVVAQVTFESALDVQTAVLDTSEHEEGIEGITEIVNAAKEEIATTPDFTGSTPSYETFIARVEAETTRARELFEAIRNSATEEEQAELLRRIEDRERSIGDATALYENGDTDAAIATLKEVLSSIQKIIVFMTDIDVRSAVALETLVPKDLTDEEYHARVLEMLSEVRDLQNVIIARAPDITDEALIEEVALGMEALDVLIVTIEEALLDEIFAEAERLAVDARTLVYDLDALTAPEVAEETETEGEQGQEDETVEEEVIEDTDENVTEDASNQESAEETQEENVAEETSEDQDQENTETETSAEENVNEQTNS